MSVNKDSIEKITQNLIALMNPENALNTEKSDKQKIAESKKNYEDLLKYIQDASVDEDGLNPNEVIPGYRLTNGIEYDWLSIPPIGRADYLSELSLAWPSYIAENLVGIMRLLAEKNAIGDLMDLIKGFFNHHKLLDSIFWGSDLTKIQDDALLLEIIKKIHPNDLDKIGNPLLFACIVLGCDKVLEFLLEMKHASANACEKLRPNYHALKLAQFSGTLKSITLLLQFGANVNQVDIKFGKTALNSLVNQAGFRIGRRSELIRTYIEEQYATTLFLRPFPKRRLLNLYGVLSEASRVYPLPIPLLLEYGAGLADQKYRICIASNRNPNYKEAFINSCQHITNFNIDLFLNAEILLLGRDAQNQLHFIYDLETLRSILISANPAIKIQKNVIANHVLNSEAFLLAPGVHSLFYEYIKAKAFNLALSMYQGHMNQTLKFEKIYAMIPKMVSSVLPFWDLHLGKQTVANIIKEGIDAAKRSVTPEGRLVKKLQKKLFCSLKADILHPQRTSTFMTAYLTQLRKTANGVIPNVAINRDRKEDNDCKKNHK